MIFRNTVQKNGYIPHIEQHSITDTVIYTLHYVFLMGGNSNALA